MPWWRAFPWDPAAAEGAPFSVRFVPPAGSQTGGRFDLGIPPVLYLAESPVHALAELLQGFRGRSLRPEHLLRADAARPGTFHPFAVVPAALPAAVEERLPDLADPAVLARERIRPDHLASHQPDVTQAVARRLHEHPAAFPGFRWWSALTGEWHVAALFLDRVRVGEVAYGVPQHVDVAHPAVVQAARFLGMT